MELAREREAPEGFVSAAAESMRILAEHRPGALPGMNMPRRRLASATLTALIGAIVHGGLTRPVPKAIAGLRFT